MSRKFVHDAQGYITGQAHREVRPPNYWVSEDGLTYVVGRYSLTIHVLRRGIQDAYNSLEEKYKRLVGDWVPATDAHPLADIIDDLGNTTRGYSFLSESPFAEHKYDCFFRVVAFRRLGAIDSHGNFCWNKPAVLAFLKDAADLWVDFGWLLSLTGQISTRLTQFMEVTFCNADHLRSFIFQAGELILLPRNHKPGHMTERDACTPGFVPFCLIRLFVRFYGGGLREAEALFTFFLTAGDAAELHRT